VVTDEGMTELAARACGEVLGEDGVIVQGKPSMGGEDFAYYLQHCPGALLWVGCAASEEDKRTLSLHHPGFAGDEKCLETAMGALAAVALSYLAEQSD